MIGFALKVYKHTSVGGSPGDLKSILPESEVNPDTMIVHLGDEYMIFWRGGYGPTKEIFPVEDWMENLEILPLTACEEFHWYFLPDDYDGINRDAYSHLVMGKTYHPEGSLMKCPRRKPFFAWVMQPNGMVTKVHVKLMWLQFNNAGFSSGNSEYTGSGLWALTTYKDPEQLIVDAPSGYATTDMSLQQNHKYRTEEYDESGTSTFRVGASL